MRPTSAPPRFATPRTPERATEGPAVAAAAHLFAGGPLLPWQRLVADVACELDEDGRYAYDEVVVIVGRRAGKTRLTHGVPLRRGIAALQAPVAHPLTGRRVPYLAAATAQNMTAAAKRLRETWDNYRTAAPEIRSRSRLLTGVNHAAIELDHRRRHGGRWESNPWASRLSVFPPTAHALRGDEYLFTAVSEALTLTLDDGQALLDATRPALTTYAGLAQMWWESNEGKESGGWLAQLKARGRAAAAAGVNTGTAYFEWSMAAGDDPEDPATWARVHPGVGLVLTEAGLARDLQVLGVDAFAREYLCKETAEAAAAPVPVAAWAACADPGAGHDPGGRSWLAFDVTPDGAQATLAAATLARDGRVHTEIRWAGPAGSLDTAVAGNARPASGRRPRGIRAAPGQAARAAALAASRHPAETLTAAQYAAACQVFADAVRDARVTHPADPRMAAALAAAAASWSKDAWYWSARRSADDITAAVATSIAVACALDAPAKATVRRTRGKPSPST